MKITQLSKQAHMSTWAVSFRTREPEHFQLFIPETSQWSEWRSKGNPIAYTDRINRKRLFIGNVSATVTTAQIQTAIIKAFTNIKASVDIRPIIARKRSQDIKGAEVNRGVVSYYAELTANAKDTEIKQQYQLPALTRPWNVRMKIPSRKWEEPNQSKDWEENAITQAVEIRNSQA